MISVLSPTAPVPLLTLITDVSYRSLQGEGHVVWSRVCGDAMSFLPWGLGVCNVPSEGKLEWFE